MITQHQDCQSTVIEAAKAGHADVVGYHYDAESLDPSGWLTGSVWNWAPLYESIIKKAQAGTFTGSQYNANFIGTYKSGDNPLDPGALRQPRCPRRCRPRSWPPRPSSRLARPSSRVRSLQQRQGAGASGQDGDPGRQSISSPASSRASWPRRDRSLCEVTPIEPWQGSRPVPVALSTVTLVPKQTALVACLDPRWRNGGARRTMTATPVGPVKPCCAERRRAYRGYYDDGAAPGPGRGQSGICPACDARRDSTRDLLVEAVGHERLRG